MQQADDVRSTLRALAKQTIRAALVRHRQGPLPNVAIFATRRGGSTWVMELLAANRGMRPLDQPFSILTGSLSPTEFRRIPKFDSGMPVALDADTEPSFRAYADDVIAGRLLPNTPTRFWSREFGRRSDRLALKIVDANPLIDWFDTNFELDIVVLTRHPIAQALSCIRNGWSLTVHAFLRSHRFVEQHMDPALEAFAHDVVATGSDLDKFVLNWTLENLVPLRLLPERQHWTLLSYEECVLRPREVVTALSEVLQLEDVDAMSRRVRIPSRSSHLSGAETRANIDAGDTTALVGGWKRHVTDEDARSSMRILDKFGIDTYRAGSLTAFPPMRRPSR